MKHSTTALSNVQKPKQETQPNNKIQKRGHDKVLEISTIVKRALSTAATWESLKKLLKAEGFELYRRGTKVGVKDMSTGTKYRMDRLGLTESFANILPKLNTMKQRQRQRASHKMRR